MLRRLVAAVPAAFLAELAACAHSVTAWRPLPVSPETLAAERPNEVRVTRTDHSTRLLYQPAVVADTLRGYSNLPASALWLVRIPVSDILALEVRHSERVPYSGSEKAAAWVVGVGLCVAMLIALTTSHWGVP